VELRDEKLDLTGFAINQADYSWAPSNLTLLRLASVKFAPIKELVIKSASLKLAPVKSAPIKEAPLKSASLRFALVKLAPDRKVSQKTRRFTEKKRFVFSSVPLCVTVCRVAISTRYRSVRLAVKIDYKQVAPDSIQTRLRQPIVVTLLPNEPGVRFYSNVDELCVALLFHERVQHL